MVGLLNTQTPNKEGQGFSSDDIRAQAAQEDSTGLFTAASGHSSDCIQRSRNRCFCKWARVGFTWASISEGLSPKAGNDRPQVHGLTMDIKFEWATLLAKVVGVWA